MNDRSAKLQRIKELEKELESLRAEIIKEEPLHNGVFFMQGPSTGYCCVACGGYFTNGHYCSRRMP